MMSNVPQKESQLSRVLHLFKNDATVGGILYSQSKISYSAGAGCVRLCKQQKYENGRRHMSLASPIESATSFQRCSPPKSV